MNLIVAVDENWSIGYKGNLLEYISGDLKYFKSKTINNTIVMGRVTFESLPGKKPLKNRKNIVLTRQNDLKIEGVTIINSIKDINKEIEPNTDIFIIGGEKIYTLLFPFCKKAFVTKIFNKYQADTKMENLDNLENWKIVNKSEICENKNGIKYQFLTYENSLPKEL